MLQMDELPRYIGQEIEAHFDQPPLLEKKPGCPNTFIWQEASFRIASVLQEWHDYGRRGRMAQNMQPAHARLAEQRGSWGVGRDYFRVRTTTGRVFELYFDRAPKDANRRKGAWFLYRELPAE